MTRRVFFLMLFLLAGAAEAAPVYRAFLAWNGPYYQVRHAQSDDSSYSAHLVSSPLPLHSTPFASPTALALWPAASSPALFVADAGHRRVQLFSAGANWRSEALSYSATPERGEFGGRAIRPSAAAWLAQSELVLLRGQPLRRVASLAGFGSSDSVYTMESDGTLRLPVGWNLGDGDSLAVEYAVAVPAGIAGMGDVDYVLAETTPAPLPLQLHDGSAAGDPVMDSLCALAVTASTRDDAALDLYLLNTGTSGSLAAYTLSHVGLGGAFDFVDSYPSPLANPADVEIVTRDASAAGSVSVGAASGVSGARIAVSVSHPALWNGHDYRLAYSFDTTSAMNVPGAAGMVETDMAFDAHTGRLHLALCRDASSARAAYSYSDDGGESWSSPVTISATAQGGTHSRPRIAVRASGELHVVYEVTLGTGERRVFHTASADGETWSVPVDVAAELPAPAVLEHRDPLLLVDPESDAVRLVWSGDDTFLERTFTTAWSAIDTILEGNGEGLRSPVAAYDAAGRIHLAFSLGTSAPYRVGHLLNDGTAWGSYLGNDFQAGVIDTVCRAAGFADAGAGRGVPYPQPQIVRVGEALGVVWAGGGTERYGTDHAELYANWIVSPIGDYSAATVSALTTGEDAAPLALSAVVDDASTLHLVYAFGTDANREGLRYKRLRAATWSPPVSAAGRDFFHAGTESATWAQAPRVIAPTLGGQVTPLLACTKAYAAWNGAPRALLKAVDGYLVITDETTHATLQRRRVWTQGEADSAAIPGLTFTISNSTSGVSNTDDADGVEFNVGDSFLLDGTLPVWKDRLFVSESDSNRIRVIHASGNADNGFGGSPYAETPGRSDGSPAQSYPLSAVGGESSYRVWVGADSAAWDIVADLSVADATDRVCEVNRFARTLRFGDGAHGAIPAYGSEIRVCYALSADEAEFGAAQLSSPRGLAARYDANHDRYDVYVCDAANQRLTKWAYQPNANLEPASWAELLYAWNTASSSTDLLQRPRDIEVVEAGNTVYLVVSDSSRLLIYRDDATPVFVAAIDSTLGAWQSPQGLAVMAEDSVLQVFAADATRGTVTKLLRREWLSPGPVDTSINTDIAPTLTLVDALDGDHYLLLQPHAVRTVELRLSGVDSLSAVDLYGEYPLEMGHLLAIQRGNLWDGTNSVSQSFSAGIDTTTGRFAIHSAILGDAAGLTSAGSRVVARLTFSADSALAIPASGVISLLDSSTLRRVNLSVVTPVDMDSLQLRGSYLADIATAGVDPGAPPEMIPVPDGRVDFEDVAAFVRAWNGDGERFDRLADIGPFAGEDAAEKRALPDGRLDAQDLLALSSMYSWDAAGAAAMQLPPPRPGNGMRNADGAIAVVARQTEQGWSVEILAHDVRELSCVRLALALPAAVSVVAEAGAALGSSALFLQSSRGGLYEICAGRLHATAASDGVLAHLHVAAGELPNFRITYDVRDKLGGSIAQGTAEPRAGVVAPLEFGLNAPFPNPFNSATTFTFTLTDAGRARLRLFNLLGQDLGVICDQHFSAGTHAIRWQTQDSGGRAFPSGLYLVRLEAAGHSATRKAILMR